MVWLLAYGSFSVATVLGYVLVDFVQLIVIDGVVELLLFLLKRFRLLDQFEVEAHIPLLLTEGQVKLFVLRPQLVEPLRQVLLTADGALLYVELKLLDLFLAFVHLALDLTQLLLLLRQSFLFVRDWTFSCTIDNSL